MNIREMALDAKKQADEKLAQQRADDFVARSEKLSEKIKAAYGESIKFEIKDFQKNNSWYSSPGIILEGITEFIIIHTGKDLETRYPDGSEYNGPIRFYGNVNTLERLGEAIIWYAEHPQQKQQVIINPRFAELKIEDANRETRPYKVLGVTHDPEEWTYIVVEYTDIEQ